MADVQAAPTDPGELVTLAAEVEDTSLALVEMTVAALTGVAPLTVPQVRMLLAVDRRGPSNLSALAAELSLSMPSASRLVDRLASAGLLDRSAAEDSRREVTITTTAAGRGSLSVLHELRRSSIAGVLGRMSNRDRSALVRGLRAFAARARA
jgi:DNA-binding MarR family transcriptional regulator